MLPHTEQSEREETFAIALVLLFFVFLIFTFPFFTSWPDGTSVYVDECGDVPQGSVINSAEEKVDILVNQRAPVGASSSAQTRPIPYKHSAPASTASQRDRQRLTPIDKVKIFPAYGPGFSMPVNRS
tara:strand:+ start:81 stop:461 length:381 start_codon:yes stop_codon:yes gene_type:complete